MSLNKFFVVFVAVVMFKGHESCLTESTSDTISVTKGSPFFIECLCTTPGYNGRHLKWLDSHNQEIDVLRPGTSQKAYTERQNDIVSLFIPSVTKAVSGLYRCVNFEGQYYSKNYIIEAYEPVTINPPQDQFILLGNRSLLKCKVHAEDMSRILISWSKVDENDTRIPITNNEKFDITNEGLFINDVVDDDKGKYSCSAYDMVALDEVDKDINVKISIAPVINDIKIIPNTTPVVGETLVLQCIADGIPHPEYIWRRTDTGAMNNSRWQKSINAIMIEPVLPEDQGTYECVAQSLAGVVTKTVDIQVYFAPNITSFRSLSGVEGSTVQLVCDAIGRPAPNISILYIGEDEDEVKDFDENDILENLSFIKLDKSRNGFYICNASNEVNYTLEEMYLTVMYKPYFEIREEIVWGWAGQIVNLTCIADSNPRPMISWRFLGEDLPTSEQVEINEYLLKTYSNSIPFYLPINVSEMTRSLYGRYECNATNDLGQDTKLIYFREGHVPPPVKNASDVSLTATSVTFYIEDAGYFQGPSILGYIGEYDVLEKYNVTNIHYNRTWSIDRPYTVENLKPDTSYLIRFAAINLVGYSEWSEYLEFRTLEPSTPSTPLWELNPELLVEDKINVTDTQQRLAWKTSDNNGAPVDYYTLKYCPMDEEGPCKEQTVLSSSELKADLNMLDQNTTYFIELVAHNNVGYSEPANITITTPANVTAPVPRLSAGALIGISVVVVFICLVILDILFLLWKRQGIMAHCCCRKKKNKVDDNLKTRDKKGLLKDSRDESERTDNRPKEYEYNKTTGIITGKHSAV